MQHEHPPPPLPPLRTVQPMVWVDHLPPSAAVQSLRRPAAAVAAASATKYPALTSVFAANGASAAAATLEGAAAVGTKKRVSLDAVTHSTTETYKGDDDEEEEDGGEVGCCGNNDDDDCKMMNLCDQYNDDDDDDVAMMIDWQPLYDHDDDIEQFDGCVDKHASLLPPSMMVGDDGQNDYEDAMEEDDKLKVDASSLLPPPSHSDDDDDIHILLLQEDDDVAPAATAAATSTNSLQNSRVGQGIESFDSDPNNGRGHNIVTSEDYDSDDQIGDMEMNFDINIDMIDIDIDMSSIQGPNCDADADAIVDANADAKFAAGLLLSEDNDRHVHSAQMKAKVSVKLTPSVSSPESTSNLEQPLNSGAQVITSPTAHGDCTKGAGQEGNPNQVSLQSSFPSLSTDSHYLASRSDEKRSGSSSQTTSPVPLVPSSSCIPSSLPPSYDHKKLSSATSCSRPTDISTTTTITTSTSVTNFPAAKAAATTSSSISTAATTTTSSSNPPSSSKTTASTDQGEFLPRTSNSVTSSTSSLQEVFEERRRLLAESMQRSRQTRQYTYSIIRHHNMKSNKQNEGRDEETRNKLRGNDDSKIGTEVATASSSSPLSCTSPPLSSYSSSLIKGHIQQRAQLSQVLSDIEKSSRQIQAHLFFQPSIPPPLSWSQPLQQQHQSSKTPTSSYPAAPESAPTLTPTLHDKGDHHTVTSVGCRVKGELTHNEASSDSNDKSNCIASNTSKDNGQGDGDITPTSSSTLEIKIATRTETETQSTSTNLLHSSSE